MAHALKGMCGDSSMAWVVPSNLCVLHNRARNDVGGNYGEGDDEQSASFAPEDGSNLLRAPMPVTTTFLFGIVDMRSEVLDEPVRLLDAVRGAPTPANPIASGSAAMAITAAAVHTRTYIWRCEGCVREWHWREVRVGGREVQPCVRCDAEEVEATATSKIWLRDVPQKAEKERVIFREFFFGKGKNEGIH